MRQPGILSLVLCACSVTTGAAIFENHHVPIKDITLSSAGYKDCRTRLTNCRPAAENVLSILFGGVDGVDANGLDRPHFNHGNNQR
jgi:hypothetical protein